MSYVTDGVSVVVARLCYRCGVLLGCQLPVQDDAKHFHLVRYWQVDPSNSQRWDSWDDVPAIRASDLWGLSCRPFCMYHSLTWIDGAAAACETKREVFFVLQTDVVDCIGCLCGAKAAHLLTEFSEAKFSTEYRLQSSLKNVLKLSNQAPFLMIELKRNLTLLSLASTFWKNQNCTNNKQTQVWKKCCCLVACSDGMWGAVA